MTIYANSLRTSIEKGKLLSRFDFNVIFSDDVTPTTSEMTSPTTTKPTTTVPTNLTSPTTTKPTTTVPTNLTSPTATEATATVPTGNPYNSHTPQNFTYNIILYKSTISLTPNHVCISLFQAKEPLPLRRIRQQQVQEKDLPKKIPE